MYKKYFKYFICLILSGIIVSCDSPDQVVVNQIVDSPSLN